MRLGRPGLLCPCFLPVGGEGRGLTHLGAPRDLCSFLCLLPSGCSNTRLNPLFSEPCSAGAPGSSGSTKGRRCSWLSGLTRGGRGGCPLAAPSPHCSGAPPTGPAPAASPRDLPCTFQAFPPPPISTIEETKTQLEKGLAPDQVWGERQREYTQLPVLVFLG